MKTVILFNGEKMHVRRSGLIASIPPLIDTVSPDEIRRARVFLNMFFEVKGPNWFMHGPHTLCALALAFWQATLGEYYSVSVPPGALILAADELFIPIRIVDGPTLVRFKMRRKSVKDIFRFSGPAL